LLVPDLLEHPVVQLVASFTETPTDSQESENLTVPEPISAIGEMPLTNHQEFPDGIAESRIEGEAEQVTVPDLIEPPDLEVVAPVVDSIPIDFEAPPFKLEEESVNADLSAVLEPPRLEPDSESRIEFPAGNEAFSPSDADEEVKEPVASQFDDPAQALTEESPGSKDAVEPALPAVMETDNNSQLLDFNASPDDPFPETDCAEVVEPEELAALQTEPLTDVPAETVDNSIFRDFDAPRDGQLPESSSIEAAETEEPLQSDAMEHPFSPIADRSNDSRLSERPAFDFEVASDGQPSEINRAQVGEVEQPIASHTDAPRQEMVESDAVEPASSAIVEIDNESQPREIPAPDFEVALAGQPFEPDSGPPESGVLEPSSRGVGEVDHKTQLPATMTHDFEVLSINPIVELDRSEPGTVEEPAISHLEHTIDASQEEVPESASAAIGEINSESEFPEPTTHDFEMVSNGDDVELDSRETEQLIPSQSEHSLTAPGENPPESDAVEPVSAAIVEIDHGSQLPDTFTDDFEVVSNDELVELDGGEPREAGQVITSETEPPVSVLGEPNAHLQFPESPALDFEALPSGQLLVAGSPEVGELEETNTFPIESHTDIPLEEPSRSNPVESASSAVVELNDDSQHSLVSTGQIPAPIDAS
jgi:hypothetical protein